MLSLVQKWFFTLEASKDVVEAGQCEDGGERGDAVLYAIDRPKDPTYEEDGGVQKEGVALPNSHAARLLVSRIHRCLHRSGRGSDTDDCANGRADVPHDADVVSERTNMQNVVFSVQCSM